MKNRFIIYIIIAFAISFVSFPYNATADEDYWERVDTIDLNTPARSDLEYDCSATASNTKSHFSMLVGNKYWEYVLTGKWTIPPKIIKPGEKIYLEISAEASPTKGEDISHPLLRIMVEVYPNYADNDFSSMVGVAATDPYKRRGDEVIDNAEITVPAISNARSKTHTKADGSKIYYEKAYSIIVVVKPLGLGSDGDLGQKYVEYIYMPSGSRPKTDKTAVPYVPQITPGVCIDSRIRFSDLYGQVEIRPHSDERAWRIAGINSVLCLEDHIRTQEDSGAILSFPDMTTLVMKPETEMIIDVASEEDSKIKLISGNIWENVKKMLKYGSAEIEMSQAGGSIKGTIFVCEETGSMSTLKVIEGSVKFTHKITGKSITVNTGEMAVADTSGISVKNFDISTEKALWEKKSDAKDLAGKQTVTYTQEKPPKTINTKDKLPIPRQIIEPKYSTSPDVGIFLVILIIIVVYAYRKVEGK